MKVDDVTFSNAQVLTAPLLLAAALCLGACGKSTPPPDHRLANAVKACDALQQNVGGAIRLGDSDHTLIVKDVDAASTSTLTKYTCVLHRLKITDATASKILSTGTGETTDKGLTFTWSNVDTLNLTVTD